MPSATQHDEQLQQWNDRSLQQWLLQQLLVRLSLSPYLLVPAAPAPHPNTPSGNVSNRVGRAYFSHDRSGST
jgi:hypothetical protein